MLKKIYNCQKYMLNEPMLPQEKERRHLYILENLSQVRVNTPKDGVTMQPCDASVGQNLMGFRLSSHDRDPLLLWLCSIEFDLPSPLDRYTVGDNPLVHDLINKNKSNKAYILFTHSTTKIRHAYLDAIEQLEQLVQDGDKYVRFQKRKIAGLLFTKLLRDHKNKVSKSGLQFPSAQAKYASQEAQSGIIIQYVTESIQTVTLKETVARFSCQPNHFSYLCQNLFGVTFNELKTHIKLELAKEQLYLTTKSLDEISRELGYRTISSLHRNFRAWTGLTPREYRQGSRLPNFED